jgi:nucleotide-binding universal stress UspA family protein
MKRILIPVDGSAKSLHAVKAVVAGCNGGVDRIDLLNVQPRLPRNVARFVPWRNRAAWRDENSRRALEPARRLVTSAGIACGTHAGTGEAAKVVAETARRLGVTEIAIGATRRGPFARLLANSLSTRLLEWSRVPVRVIPVAPAPALDRLAAPVGIGLAILAVAVAD